jgi:hypothetical protein
MKHTARIAVVAATAVGASVVVSSRVPAQAVQGLQSGYWWQGQPAGAPLPPPPNVPANGLWVSGGPDNVVAISAIRFQLRADEAAPVLTVKVNSQFPPKQLSDPTNVGQDVVLACPATGAWKAAAAGAWNAKPQYNCTGAVHGTPSADGTVISFDLGAVAADSKVDVVLVPGTGAAAIPAVPVPVPGAPAQPNGFDLTLQPVTADQVHTSPGGAADSAGTAGPAPATEAPTLSPDLAPATDVGSVGGPAPAFNYAANAVVPAAGTAASSTPSVAPGSLVPQTRGIAESTIKENKGYRALAAILLAVLLWWAWRQAMPPRRGRRTIYDGPPATPA